MVMRAGYGFGTGLASVGLDVFSTYIFEMPTELEELAREIERVYDLPPDSLNSAVRLHVYIHYMLYYIYINRL